MTRGGSRGKYFGERQKVDDLFLVVALKHRPKLPNQPLQPSKDRPLYHCLLVLLLLQPKIWGQGSGLGRQLPPLGRQLPSLPQRITAPVNDTALI